MEDKNVVRGWLPRDKPIGVPEIEVHEVSGHGAEISG